ncbi:MAG: hypothetical protein K9M99_07775 [Candidatus Cloacimonetes bacterium]|nr:hypothetical protein [Candidatus Cloacimonadota bacterium]
MMNRTKTMLMLITMLLPVLLMSFEYDFNNYQVPDYFSHGLNFTLDNTGRITDNDSETNSRHDENIYADYFARKYNRENILDISLKTRLRYYLYSVETTDSQNTYYDRYEVSFDFEIDATLRRYVIGDWFCNIDADCSAKSYYSESDSKEVNINKDDDGESYTYQESGGIGLGYGRVQDVSKACQAVEILSELEKAGLLIREVTQEDIESLSNLLVELTTLRLFDSRLIKKEKVRQINRYLNEKGLQAGDSIESFVIIMDLYNLGTVFQRESGWDVYSSFRLENYDYSRESCSETVYIDTTYNDYTSDYEAEASSTTYQPGINFNYSRVLSSRWQLETSGSYEYFWLENKSENTIIRRYETYIDSVWEKSEFDIEGYIVELDIKLSWYLDTRTRIWSGLEYTISDRYFDEWYDYVDSEDEAENESYQKSYSKFQRYYMITAGMEYYFSPKLSLTLTASYRDDNGENDSQYINPFTYYFYYDSVFDYRLRVMYYLF